MSEELLAFLNMYTAVVDETITWGPLRFSVRSFLCSVTPPVAFVTSIRAVVLQEGKVLVVRDPQNTHITPGGRCEPNESWVETLRREIAEETGWKIHRLSLLGLKHFHHLTAKPDKYEYPYPDFCQMIYRAEAIEYDPGLLDPKRYELEAIFRTTSEVTALRLTPSERHFLDAALRK
jgi:ADP-ribose pyrophosphatase YjhB (NUDIX family)